MRWIISTCLLLLGACGGQPSAEPEILSESKAITVGPVHCNGCVASIEALVGRYPGAELGAIDLPGQTAQIRLPAGTDWTAFAAALKAINKGEIAASAPIGPRPPAGIPTGD